MFSLFSSQSPFMVSSSGPEAINAAVTANSATSASFSDLVIPSIGKLLDPEVSPVVVAKDLAHAAAQKAGGVAGDLAVPDGIETVARWVGADGLLARFGPARAASAVTESLFEKIMTGPMLKGCMAVIEKYSSILSLSISGLTALQFGVGFAAVAAAGYALYRYFKGPKERAATPSPAVESSRLVEIAPA